MAKNLLVNSVTALVALSLILELVACMSVPSNELDYDNLRDLYEMLLRNSEAQALASGYHSGSPASGYSPILRFRNHQMERKGGTGNRQLRLRFGKRSDRTGEGEFANSYLLPDALIGTPVDSVQVTSSSDQTENKM